MEITAIRTRVLELLELGKTVLSTPNLIQIIELVHGAISVCEICYGPDSTQVKGLVVHQQSLTTPKGRFGDNPKMNAAYTQGVLTNLLSNVEQGLIGSFQQTVAGEVLGDLLGLAKEALLRKEQAAVNVAAVLTAAAYEDALRRMGHQLAGISDRPNLETVIQKLKESGHLKGAQVSTAAGYLPFRNNALHADWKNVETTTVHSCLAFVEQLLLKHFS